MTTEANAQVAKVHNRMPVIVAPEEYDVWMNPAVQGRGPLENILRPYPADRMESWPVSPRVNNPQEDDVGLVDARGSVVPSGSLSVDF